MRACLGYVWVGLLGGLLLGLILGASWPGRQSVAPAPASSAWTIILTTRGDLPQSAQADLGDEQRPQDVYTYRDPAEALAARDELTADSPEHLLLHGNFRQGKVLSGDRTPWLAVGPEPLVGERAYDLARLVRDRVEDLIATSAGPSAARRRVNRLADSLDVDRDRLRGWTLFRAVESGTRAIAAGRTAEGELALEFAAWL